MRSLLAVTAFVAVVAVVAAVVWAMVNSRRDSAKAKARLREFCTEKHGNYWEDLVDGDLHIQLEGTHLSQADLRKLSTLLARCVSSDLGGTASHHLDLDKTTVDGGDILSIVTEHTIGLSLEGHDFSDADAERLCELAPRMSVLGLRNTKVSDTAMKHISPLPLRELDIGHTIVSVKGLQHLSSTAKIYRLTVSSGQIDEESFDQVRQRLSGREIETLE